MTLRSESSIQILDLLCEGTIEGRGSERSKPEERLNKQGQSVNEPSAISDDARHAELRNGHTANAHTETDCLEHFTHQS